MKIINLTPEQELKILRIWETKSDNELPGIKELTSIIFPEISEDQKDGRSIYGRAIKKFLANNNLKVKSTTEYQPKEKNDLTEEQKEYIEKYAATMTSVQIARILFENDQLTNLNIETRIVNDYIKSLPKVISLLETEEVVEGEYRPPKSTDKIINKINRYVLNGIDKEKISPIQKNGLNALMSYLHTYRFIHQMNSYADQKDKDLFESSFIRYCYDKPDLTQEEVDQYIVLAGEVVISSNIQKTIQMVQGQIDAQVESEGKIPMTLVEASNVARNEYNQCVTRQQKLINDLKIKRSERLSKLVKDNASILNLVQLWKEHETRSQIIKLAEKRKSLVKNEIDRLSSMDELKCRVIGLSEDELLNE
jgi:hypothetical protein